MITVHLVGNAHLDPVWFWRWPAGVGEAIGTCRSAADRLDETPEFVFTRSDVWLYEQIEQLDPDLFERIRGHVAEGRWQIVGGWYIQPDCNLPTEASFRKHMEIGEAYFRDKFGFKVTVGYNVDSFGHHGMLPSFLRDAGYDSYVMMRPMANEKDLPSSLFQWEAQDGARVLTWRIPKAYTSRQTDLTEHIEASLEVANPAVGHVMCFYGVGDHGGGPTKDQIRWLLEHRDAFPDARLEFSHPRAFFDAVRPSADALPVVRDELQMHAVGCYTVVHDLKRRMRRAEHGLARAEAGLARYPDEAPEQASARLDEAWKSTLFNQFHDTYGGTSIPSACEDASEQLGAARDTGEKLLHDVLYRRSRHLPPDRWQRIVVLNASDAPFEGYLQHEPWFRGGSPERWLADAEGRRVAHQFIQQETAGSAESKRRWLWPASMAPREEQVFQVRTDPAPELPEPRLEAGDGAIANDSWRIVGGVGDELVKIERRSDGGPLFGESGLSLVVRHDPSDTWSHGIPGFHESEAGRFEVESVTLEDAGPVRASLRVEAGLDASRLTLWARLYEGDPRIELGLWLDWRQRLAVSKLVMPFAGSITHRRDGIPGGHIERPQSGQEFPFGDWTQVDVNGGRSIGVVGPDCFGVDGEGDALRFTLLRSPAYAWHVPAELDPRVFYRYTDQGEYGFRFVLVEDSNPEALAGLALAEHRTPCCIDWTYGMS